MRFRIILADPPWSYGGSDQFQSGRGRSINGKAAKIYSTMRDEDILHLAVASIAEDDCILLVWATPPLLSLALDVGEAWGFEYVTKIPWVKIVGEPTVSLFGDVAMKPQYGIGFWGRGVSEDLLIFRRGNPKPTPAARDSVLIFSENFKHSRKPDNAYEYAEYHDGPYVELFARRERAGWVSLGNEIDGLDIREAIARLARM